jgi:hypothetical protein
MMCTQTIIPTSLKQSSPKSHDQVINVALPTSTLEDDKESNFTKLTIIEPPPSLLKYVASSSTAQILRYNPHLRLIIFASISSDSDKSDDEFDLFAIFYLSNFVDNKSLPLCDPFSRAPHRR